MSFWFFLITIEECWSKVREYYIYNMINILGDLSLWVSSCFEYIAHLHKMDSKGKSQ